MPTRQKLSYPNNILELSSKINSKIIVGRVIDIILDTEHNDFEAYGGYSSIGTIFWEENNLRGSSNKHTAKPFYPQISAYPLVNELVLLISLPNKNIGINTSSESYYYINMLSIWNSPHHNAYPNPTKSNTPASQQKDYSITDKGSPIREIDEDGTGLNLNSPTNPYQNTFFERSNIHPLLPFAGDVIQEGRWGNSIRLGSTAKPPRLNSFNDWSKTGINGDPITILRNGQTPSLKDIQGNPLPGFVNIVEKINSDLSSIYMTSTQEIPITTNPVEFDGKRYSSYTPSQNVFEKNEPDTPDTYTGSQVILNSGRLLFNSKSDHIMLSSNKTISFEAIKGFNFDTSGHCVINVGTQVKLGGKEATEPIVLGESLRFQLESLCNELKNLMKILKYAQDWPGGSGPIPNNALSMAASNMETTLGTIIPQLKKDENDNCPILSNISKTL